MNSTLLTPLRPSWDARVKLLAAAPRALTPLALVAAALAIVVPSAAVAGRSDLLLALLVLATALGISWLANWPACARTPARWRSSRWRRWSFWRPSPGARAAV